MFSEYNNILSEPHIIVNYDKIDQISIAIHEYDNKISNELNSSKTRCDKLELLRNIRLEVLIMIDEQGNHKRNLLSKS